MKSIRRRPMGATRHGKQRPRRRGAVAAQVAICLSTLVGFMALSVDVGHMYNVKAELQRTADASALAAAMALSDWSGGDPRPNSIAVAQEYANINFVLGEGVELEVEEDTGKMDYSGDVQFGAASMLESGKYEIDWYENDPLRVNAVRVTVRRTEDSPSKAVPLFFAQVFGVDATDISASATAVMTPRDIVFVLDLSASHNDDSSLRSYRNPDLDEIANKDVYDALADEPDLTPQMDSLGFESAVAVIDNGDGTSTISIDLTSASAAKALSHVTFGLPETAQAMVEASAETTGDYDAPEWGTDPTTGVTGLKFDAVGDGLGEDGVVETHSFSFTVNNADLQELTVATKAGTGTDVDSVYNLKNKLTIGNLRDWGDEVTNIDWDCTADPGMFRLKKDRNWGFSKEWLSQTAVDRGWPEYTTAQVNSINNSSNSLEYWSTYEQRARVALGIDYWEDTDGDNHIDSGEVTEMIAYPDEASNPDTLCKEVGGSWNGFIRYVSGRYYTASMRYYYPSSGYYGNDDLRYRFGLKTFVDYLQDRVGDFKSPGMAGTPSQPMGAVADASKELLDFLGELESQDQVAMSSYATVAYSPENKPDEMSWLTTDFDEVSEKIDRLYPGMWTTTTNVADGIEKGRSVLFESFDARDEAAKVMILLTDGIANQTRSDSALSPADDALEAAREAAENYDPEYSRPIQIHTISVGGNADQNLMAAIAEIGSGEHFHAEGSIDEYRTQLRAIFQELGGRRPVVLIE